MNELITMPVSIITLKCLNKIPDNIFKTLLDKFNQLTKPGEFINFTVLVNHLNDPTDLYLNNPIEDLYYPIVFYNSYTPLIEGNVVWEKLPFESLELYKMFRDYREKGPSRMIYEIARKYNLSPREIIKISKIFYWKERINYYENYTQSIQSKVLNVRQQEIQESYYLVGKDLFQKAVEYCSKNLNEFKPKEILDLMKLATDLAKFSVGLDGSPRSVVNISNNTHSGDNILNKNDIDVNQINTTNDSPAMSNIQSILSIMDRIGALSPEEDELESIDNEEVIIINEDQQN